MQLPALVPKKLKNYPGAGSIYYLSYRLGDEKLKGKKKELKDRPKMATKKT